MSNKNPLVSIAMATYNGEKYLEEQLDSLISQTYQNIEIIICDDNSSDNTVENIKKYQKIDKRIKLYINENNLGYVKNFEKAIKLCNGKYIALADQDDIWDIEKIEILVANIENFDLIHTDFKVINEDSKILYNNWKKDNIDSFPKLNNVFHRNNVTGCTVLFSRKLIDKAFPIPDGELYHDWWLAIMATKNNGIKYINNPLTFYRSHVNQQIGVVQISRIERFIKFFTRDTEQMKFCKIQLKRLPSLIQDSRFTSKEKTILKELLQYEEDYVQNRIHFKTFWYGIKHSLHKKNYFFIKSIIKDLIG